MKLCFVVRVVSHLSLRPCKESHHRAAQPHCAPTAIPELTHLSSSSLSVLQIYVRDPTGHQEDADATLFALLHSQATVGFVFQFIIVKKLLFKAKPLEGESDLVRLDQTEFLRTFIKILLLSKTEKA